MYLYDCVILQQTCCCEGLLSEYMMARTTVENQQGTLNALKNEMDDLLHRIETTCKADSC